MDSNYHLIAPDEHRDCWRLFQGDKYIAAIGNSDDSKEQIEAEARHILECLTGDRIKCLEECLTRAEEDGRKYHDAKLVIGELLFAAENADETGYVTDVGFLDLEALHAKARAFIAE